MNGKKIGAGYARGGGTWRASGGIEQGQNATGVVDGMGQHRVGRLGQNAGAHEVDGFGRHVGVLNSGARCCIIFRHHVQVVNRVFEAGLDGTEFAAVDLSAGHDNKQYVSDPPTHDSPARVSR